MARAGPAVLLLRITIQADPAVRRVTVLTDAAVPETVHRTMARVDPAVPADLGVPADRGMATTNVATSMEPRGVTGPHHGVGVRRRGQSGADHFRGLAAHG